MIFFLRIDETSIFELCKKEVRLNEYGDRIFNIIINDKFSPREQGINVIHIRIFNIHVLHSLDGNV